MQLVKRMKMERLYLMRLGKGMKVIRLSFIFILLMVSSAWAGDCSQVVLRTPQQFKRGLLGGEGMQQIQSLCYAPSLPSIAYMGTDTSQVWRSDNGGKTWKHSSVGFASHGALSLLVHPLRSEVVWAIGSLGEKKERYEKFRNKAVEEGIYRSIDAGQNWELLRKMGSYKTTRCGSGSFWGLLNLLGGESFMQPLPTAR